MYKIIIVFIIIVLSFCGCASIGAIESARNSIAELERLNAEQKSRNIELEQLLKSERETNSDIKRILDEKRSELEEYFRSEGERFTDERDSLDRLYKIFGDESAIIKKLIIGYNEIRDYFESLEVLE